MFSVPRSGLSVALAILSTACGTGPANAPIDAAASEDATHVDAPRDDDASVACATTPSYAQLRDTIFVPHCTTGRCHGGTDGPPPGRGPSDFTAGSTRLALVDRASVYRSGFVLVRAGDPEGSFLMAKLTNDLPSDPRLRGVAMPPAATGHAWVPLPASDVALVRCWIIGGAP